MCGIVGLINKNKDAQKEVITAMSSRVIHRGPDGHGLHLYKQFGIAHRRLSFIDVEGGAQPLCNEDGSIWISYNGELYNFQDLRLELEKLGHIFKTKSDTEVIIHAYEEWGTDCPKRFQGMFAFVILDQNKEQVFIARDHIGIKPLFYSVQEGFTAIASELQAFKSVPEFDFSLDLRAMDQYLWFQYILAPNTIFEKVKKLEPGHSLIFNSEGKIIYHENYWDFKFKPNKKPSASEWVERLDATIQKSVKKHLVSEVPFGAFLSGGIDSTAVVTYMQEILDYPVKTFSIGFEEADFNELPYAQQVADTLGTDHTVKIVKPEALEILPELVRHYGEPFGDSSAIPTYYVSQMASENVKMVLSGDGGDEALAGYKTYSSFMHYQYVEEDAGLKRMAYNFASAIRPMKYPPLHSVKKWYPYVQYLALDWRKDLWKDNYHDFVNTSSKEFEYYYGSTKNFSPIHKLQFLDLKTYLPGDILTKVDVASMMHSLEVRTPLVDKNLWELSAQIPAELNLNKVDGNWSGKQLLKQILRKKYPDDFIYRKKMGFSIPRDKWFGTKNSTRTRLEEILYDPGSHVSEYFKLSGIERILNSNNYGAMWLLLFLEFWLKDFHETK
ncbi:MAG: asparagine synthase (glutamine-hydrolyzing) [Crocinitomicaceae bacterium]|jgi:asparagine synthase (glutamine-hydrolysing)|nr:asparagine synthase (glutamine-hydrolyzing) [Crocinitomicaceae bacterium]MBT6513488.1 asparagine synthase (glutamine-hydrolyzing) [Crocinitomicaceae bacterium]MDG2330683.1 asparagine synthase (glutamine-hydrolyzing) [Flavobacteriales bacterium]